jgi:hypothetical protein
MLPGNIDGIIKESQAQIISFNNRSVTEEANGNAANLFSDLVYYADNNNEVFKIVEKTKGRKANGNPNEYTYITEVTYNLTSNSTKIKYLFDTSITDDIKSNVSLPEYIKTIATSNSLSIPANTVISSVHPTHTSNMYTFESSYRLMTPTNNPLTNLVYIKNNTNNEKIMKLIISSSTSEIMSRTIYDYKRNVIMLFDDNANLHSTMKLVNDFVLPIMATPIIDAHQLASPVIYMGNTYHVHRTQYEDNNGLLIKEHNKLYTDSSMTTLAHEVIYDKLPFGNFYLITTIDSTSGATTKSLSEI